MSLKSKTEELRQHEVDIGKIVQKLTRTLENIQPLGKNLFYDIAQDKVYIKQGSTLIEYKNDTNSTKKYR